MKQVIIYTDGACSGNPGPGGWGVVLRYGQHEKELSGGEKETTNNRMELTAAIKGLEALKEPCVVKLVTDSKYVADGIIKGWAESWQNRFQSPFRGRNGSICFCRLPSRQKPHDSIREKPARRASRRSVKPTRRDRRIYPMTKRPSAGAKSCRTILLASQRVFVLYCFCIQ